MSYRLWFRLDDVLPLAEHAMACPGHRITGAQARGLAPLRPGLIWSGTSNADLLASNGVPSWYTEHGDVHIAEARTWRRTATGQAGVAGRPDYFQAFLPLDTATGAEPVISMLRDARYTGRHWVTIDIDPADRHVVRSERVGVVEHRDLLVPAGTRWVPATVTSTGIGDAAYPALVPDGYTTNTGFEIPRFNRTTVQRMVAELNAVHTDPDLRSDAIPGEYPYLAGVGDDLLVYEEHDHGEHTAWHLTGRIPADRDGRYPLGAYTWPWRRAGVA